MNINRERNLFISALRCRFAMKISIIADEINHIAIKLHLPFCIRIRTLILSNRMCERYGHTLHDYFILCMEFVDFNTLDDSGVWM